MPLKNKIKELLFERKIPFATMLVSTCTNINNISVIEGLHVLVLSHLVYMLSFGIKKKFFFLIDRISTKENLNI